MCISFYVLLLFVHVSFLYYFYIVRFQWTKKKAKNIKRNFTFLFLCTIWKTFSFLKQGMVFFKSLCMQTLSPRPFFLYKMFYFWLLSVHGNIFLLHKNIFFSSIYFLAFLSFRVFRWIIIRIIIQKNVKKNSLD